MKVIAVTGSPEKTGYTNTLINAFCDSARQAGHEIVHYDVNAMYLRGCQSCKACKKADLTYCVIKDDLRPYWQDLQQAGALIVGAPNYASNVCGPMITYMNRHYCLIGEDLQVRHPLPIKLIGVFSQGRPDASTYRDVYTWYLSDFERRGMTLIDLLIHTGYEPLTPDHPLMQRACELGKIL